MPCNQPFPLSRDLVVCLVHKDLLEPRVIVVKLVTRVHLVNQERQDAREMPVHLDKVEHL